MGYIDKLHSWYHSVAGDDALPSSAPPKQKPKPQTPPPSPIIAPYDPKSLYRRIEEQGVDLVKSFIADVKIVGSSYISDETKVTLARISNDDLMRGDLALIAEYKILKAVGWDGKAEKIRQEIIRKYTDLNISLLRNYDGKISLTNSSQARRISALGFVIDDLGIMTEAELDAATRLIYTQFLNGDDSKLLNDYEAAKKGGRGDEISDLEGKICQRAILYQDATGSTLYGDPTGIGLVKNAQAFFQMALLLGIPVEYLPYRSSFGLSEFNALSAVELAIRTPERMDDRDYISLVKGKCEKLYREYVSALSDGQVNPEYLSILEERTRIYFHLARSLRVPQPELNSIISVVDGEFKGEMKYSELGFNEMAGGYSAYVITPDMLPEGVKEHLSSIEKAPGLSYYDWVRNNVKMLVVTSTLVVDANQVGDSGALGSVSGFLPIINLDIYDESSGQVYSDAEMAGTIVHEADHVEYWTKYYGSDKALASVFTEGHAFFEGYKFENGLYQKKFASDPRSNEAKRLLKNLRASERTYKSALSIIGAQLVGREFNVDALLAAANPELEYATYPTQTVYAYVDWLSSELSGNIGLSTDEVRKLKEVLTKLCTSPTPPDLSGDRDVRAIVHKVISAAYPEYASLPTGQAIKLIKEADFKRGYVRDGNKELISGLIYKMDELYASGRKFSDEEIGKYFFIKWLKSGGLAEFRTEGEQLKLFIKLLSDAVHFKVIELGAARKALEDVNRPAAEILKDYPDAVNSDIDLALFQIISDRIISQRH